MNLESYLVSDHCALYIRTFVKNNFMILLGDLYIVKQISPWWDQDWKRTQNRDWHCSGFCSRKNKTMYVCGDMTAESIEDLFLFAVTP